MKIKKENFTIKSDKTYKQIKNNRNRAKLSEELYKEYQQEQKNILINFVMIVALTIVTLSFIRGIFNPNSTYSFTQFLQNLVEISNYQISIVNLGDLAIGGDWGILDGLRMFLNSIMSILNLLVWLAQTLINVLIIAIQMLRIIIFGN